MEDGRIFISSVDFRHETMYNSIRKEEKSGSEKNFSAIGVSSERTAYAMKKAEAGKDRNGKRRNARMSEITAITPQVKDKTRCNVYLDGRFYCGLTLETAMKYRLKAGMIADEKRLDEIQSESEKNVALDKALTHISACSKTEKDVRSFLRKKGYLSGVEDYVIGKMRSYGFIDDKAYAKTYALSAMKKKGRRLIEYELRGKGISEEEIAAAFSEIEEERERGEETADEYGAAQAIAEKFMRGKATKESDPEAHKTALAALYRRLASRGFDGETIKEIVAQYRGGYDEY